MTIKVKTPSHDTATAVITCDEMRSDTIYRNVARPSIYAIQPSDDEHNIYFIGEGYFRTFPYMSDFRTYIVDAEISDCWEPVSATLNISVELA